MIILEPSDEQIEEAKRKAYGMGHIRNSITQGAGNFAGFIAEDLVAEHLDAQHTSTKDYDLTYNGRTIDVKTKNTSAVPLPHYMCSIASTSEHQECDYYVFCRWHKYERALYVLGSMSQTSFYANATFYEKGEKEGDNGFTVRADCWSLPISELYDIDSLTARIDGVIVDEH